jgi:processive 1,2-diacylglycerol beta-glucosyltransferase
MPKRILVISASVGAGHVRAAEAVELALRQLAPEAEIRNIDVLEWTNAAFRRVYAVPYVAMVNRAPQVLGFVYDRLNRPPQQHRYDRLRLLIERLNLKRFIGLLREISFDVIVNTHFLPAEIMAFLRRQERISTPQLTVTTDFDTHRLWVHQPCEHYFTATEEGAANLRYWGVPAGDISVTGIPIHPVFSRVKDSLECRQRLGMGNDRPVIVQMAGGFGMGPVESIFSGVLAVELPLEVVVVAGHNGRLKSRLEQMKTPSRHRVTVMGYTNEVDELMAAADIVLTKPGGLTTSEALARGAALVMAIPSPGPEARNCDYVLENGAGVKVNDLHNLAHKISRLLDEPACLQQMKANARRLGRPQAAFDIARAALGYT